MHADIYFSLTVPGSYACWHEMQIMLYDYLTYTNYDKGSSIQTKCCTYKCVRSLCMHTLVLYIQ